MTVTPNQVKRKLAPLAVTLTSDTTLTAQEHAAKNAIVLDSASGLTVTLPAATGTGQKYRFVIATTVTSNDYIIQVANSTDVFVGQVKLLQDSADTIVGFEAASTSDTVTMNGTTKGGLLGTVIEITDIASGKFSIDGTGAATGTEVTPFSAAV